MGGRSCPNQRGGAQALRFLELGPLGKSTRCELEQPKFRVVTELGDGQVF